MADAYEHLRNLPLMLVLDALLGEQVWKGRKNGTEWYGKCPIHGAKRNQTSFSFHEDGRFRCFSCPAKGRGAIDLLMQIRRVNFRGAVAILEELKPKLTGRVPRSEIVPVAPETLTTSGAKQSKESEELRVDNRVDNRTENAPFNGSYEKFKVDSAWLKARGFTPETLDRFEVFQYDNPKRRSQYTGSVMLKIRRYGDGASVGDLARNIGEITPEKPKYRFPAGLQKSSSGALGKSKTPPLN